MADKLYDYESDSDMSESEMLNDMYFEMNKEHYESNGSMSFLMRRKNYIEKELKAIKRAISLRKKRDAKKEKAKNKKTI